MSCRLIKTLTSLNRVRLHFQSLHQTVTCSQQSKYFPAYFQGILQRNYIPISPTHSHIWLTEPPTFIGCKCSCPCTAGVLLTVALLLQHTRTWLCCSFPPFLYLENSCFPFRPADAGRRLTFGTRFQTKLTFIGLSGTRPPSSWGLRIPHKGRSAPKEPGDMDGKRKHCCAKLWLVWSRGGWTDVWRRLLGN